MEKLYYKMYEDVKSIPGKSVVIEPDQMIDEINASRECGCDMPVFEPVFMTESEFNELPEFTGF